MPAIASGCRRSPACEGCRRTTPIAASSPQHRIRCPHSLPSRNSAGVWDPDSSTRCKAAVMSDRPLMYDLYPRVLRVCNPEITSGGRRRSHVPYGILIEPRGRREVIGLNKIRKRRQVWRQWPKSEVLKPSWQRQNFPTHQEFTYTGLRLLIARDELLQSRCHYQRRLQAVPVCLDAFECYCAPPFLLGPHHQLFRRVWD